MTEESSFWLKPFFDLSLATMFAHEQVPGISAVKGLKEDRNRGKAVKWCSDKAESSSSSRDVHNLIWSPSSAGPKAPTEVEDGIMKLTITPDFSQLRLGLC